MKISKDNEMTVIDLESDGAFSAFRMGMEDRRQWQRHPETQELNNYVVDNCRAEHIVVRYGDATVRVK